MAEGLNHQHYQALWVLYQKLHLLTNMHNKQLGYQHDELIGVYIDALPKTLHYPADCKDSDTDADRDKAHDTQRQLTTDCEPLLLMPEWTHMHWPTFPWHQLAKH